VLVHGSFGDLRLKNPAGPWYLAWGSWWSVVFALDRTFSFGVHVEPRRLHNRGPYVDVHLPALCVSLGRWPVYQGSLESQRAYARGGLS
jgi:hypothetical protein